MNAFFRTMGAALFVASFLSIVPSAAFGATVAVVMPGGQVLNVSVESEATVGQLKSKIYAISELSEFNQIIFKGETKLENSRTLASYRIGDSDTIVVHHGVTSAPTSRTSSGYLWIILGFLAVVGVGIFFMVRKPPNAGPR